MCAKVLGSNAFAHQMLLKPAAALQHIHTITIIIMITILTILYLYNLTLKYVTPSCTKYQPHTANIKLAN